MDITTDTGCSHCSAMLALVDGVFVDGVGEDTCSTGETHLPILDSDEVYVPGFGVTR